MRMSQASHDGGAEVDVPVDAHVYDIWANGGIDPWEANSLETVVGPLLIYGPRGCGKTFLSNAFFANAGRAVIPLEPAEILKNPDANLNALMRATQRISRPGILAEDVDQLLVALRAYPSARQTWLAFLKHLPQDVAVCATATRPEDLQPAELDVFKYVLPVFYGDARLREVTMVAHAADLPLDVDVDFQEVAELTEWWSGQELMQLIRHAPRNERGWVTRDNVIRQLRLMASNIVAGQRAKRMQELFRFTADHGTSNVIREEIAGRFGPGFVVPTAAVPITIQIGELHVGENKFNIQQAGVVVTGGRVDRIEFEQSWVKAADGIDATQLAADLAILLRRLQEQPNHAEHQAEVDSVGAAQAEASKGNAAGALAALSKAGKWAFDVATQIGVRVAAEALKRSMSVP